MIKLIDIYRLLHEGTRVGFPNILYHATYKPLLPKIKKYGLDSNQGKPNWADSKSGVIYLATDKWEAEAYAEASEEVPETWLDKIIVFEIATQDLDKALLRPDSNVIDGTTTFEYHGTIPYKNLKITNI